MEKEQILSTITERLKAEGQTSLSQRTLGDYINDNLPSEGTEPDEAYWERHTKFLKSLSVNFSNDMAAAVNDFKTNYKPSTSAPETQHKGKESDLMRRIEQLETKLAESAKHASATNLRSEVTAKGKSLKVANEAIWEDAVKAVQIGDNDTAEDVTAKAKREYERLLKRYHGDGAAPYGSSGRQGASKEAEKEAADRRARFIEKMQRSGKLPKKENQ